MSFLKNLVTSPITNLSIKRHKATFRFNTIHIYVRNCSFLVSKTKKWRLIFSFALVHFSYAFSVYFLLKIYSYFQVLISLLATDFLKFAYQTQIPNKQANTLFLKNKSMFYIQGCIFFTFFTSKRKTYLLDLQRKERKTALCILCRKKFHAPITFKQFHLLFFLRLFICNTNLDHLKASYK